MIGIGLSLSVLYYNIKQIPFLLVNVTLTDAACEALNPSE